MPTMKKTVIYARFSTDLQSDASIEDQIAACRRYAECEGHEVVGTYSDAAKSGASTIGRDGLQDLMADAKAGAFNAVLVESLDRISRDQEDLAHIWKRLSFLGVDLVAIGEGKADHIAVGVRGLLGALYLKDLADKTRRGLSGRISAGKSAGGKAYGYRPVPGQPGELEIVPEEAAVVRRIFEEYAGGKSPRQIAAGLNADGILPPRGAQWAANTINGSVKRGTGILRVELYRGKLVWNKLRYVKDPNTGKRVSRLNPREEWQEADAPHLRLIDGELWQRVQARAEQRRHDTSIKAKGQRRFLSGLLKCGSCQSSMVVSGGGHDPNDRRIRCSRNRESGTCDHSRSYRLQAIELCVVEVLRDVLSREDALKEFLDVYVERRKARMQDIAKRRRKAEIAFKRADDAAQRLVSMYADDKISLEHFNREYPKRCAEADEAKRELARTAEAPAIDLHPNAWQAHTEAVQNLYEILQRSAVNGDEQTLAAVRDLVHSVVIYPSEKPGQVEVEMFSQLRVLTKTGAGEYKTVVAGVGFEPTTFRL